MFGFPELVVECPLTVLVLEYLVGGINLFELFLELFVPLGLVRVVFLGQLIVCFFDVCRFSTRGDPQSLIKVGFSVIPEAEGPTRELSKALLA